jgi:hypothetical protein
MKLFLPEKILEEWSLSEAADLSDGYLVVHETQSKHAVASAIHFAKLASGEDANNLLGRVKTFEQVAHLNPEHMADSCLIGDTAYEVHMGYVADVAAVAPVAKVEHKKKSASPEADLLAAFILDKL